MRWLIPQRRAGMLWRFLLAGMLVIGATAATTTVAGLLQVKQLTKYLDETAPLKNAQVTLPAPGAPETLLLIGSDHRASDPNYNDANTDTMMLVRLDPASSTINVLSIPRDLKVDIPGHGIDRINAAYHAGGPNLMLKTIKQAVFPDLRVNHILDVNFGGFSDLIDAIGCVYSQVDHRYYNDTALTGYSSIDIQPGYQKLCGHNQSVSGALAFVRFRHTDTDIVRNARQQDFLRWAKDQYGTAQILNNKDKLLRIFGAHVKTDRSLHTTDGVLSLFDLVLNMSAHTVKSVPFPAILQPCVATAPGATAAPCYVTSTPRTEAAAFAKFMKPTTAVAATAKTHPKVTIKRRAGHRAAASVPGLVDGTTEGQAQAARLARARMPVYYPKLMMGGSNVSYCSSLIGNCDTFQEPASQYAASYPRAYTIHDKRGRPYVAYYMTVALNQTLGQYYGVQGTTWNNPPLLAGPSGTKVVDGKKLYLYAAGGKLTTVAWHTPQGAYWIANTLNNSITNQQMVALAASLTRAA
jgi:LCP family protein required for cell wall assembly